MPAATGRYDDFRGDFESSSGTWGYGSTQLGTAYYYVQWQLTGARTVSKPVRWYTSRNTINVVWSGDLLNAAPGATGTPVSGKYAPYVVGNATAYTPKTWDPNGYQSFDNTMWDHAQVNQFSWSLSGYTGYWYAYIKSISSHTTVLGTGALYRLRAVTGLPASAYGGGYRL